MDPITWQQIAATGALFVAYQGDLAALKKSGASVVGVTVDVATVREQTLALLSAAPPGVAGSITGVKLKVVVGLASADKLLEWWSTFGPPPSPKYATPMQTLAALAGGSVEKLAAGAMMLSAEHGLADAATADRLGAWFAALADQSREGWVKMVDAPGLDIRDPERAWTTLAVRALLLAAGEAADVLGGKLRVADIGPPVRGAEFELKEGGAHKSHRWGLDADIAYTLNAYPTEPDVPVDGRVLEILAGLAPHLDRVGVNEVRAPAFVGAPYLVSEWPGHIKHAHIRFKSGLGAAQVETEAKSPSKGAGIGTGIIIALALVVLTEGFRHR